MSRVTSKLSDAKVRAEKKPGRYSDGGGLYLNVSPSVTKSWIFMWVREGKRREMGLGPYPTVSLSQARTKAHEARTVIQSGEDPLVNKRKASEPTFGECASQFLSSMEHFWRNEKHRAQWKMTLEVYCETLREMRVSAVATDDVLEVLAPIWNEKPETASRLRGRIERVLDFAKVKGWRSGENPALWRGHLKNVLPPRRRLTRGHHAAMPFEQVPNFMKRLRTAEAMAARALEFLLTAARSGEVYGATWEEIDLDKALWVIPAHRMKAGTIHRVPLSPRAVELLKDLHDAHLSSFVFPGQRAGRPLSSSAMEMLLRRMKADKYTVHGFRSAFRDWAGDRTNFPRELAEAALAHRVGDATERAYRRSDALHRRRELMCAWSEYLVDAQVVHAAQDQPGGDAHLRI